MRDIVAGVIGTILGIFLWIAWNREDWLYGILSLVLIVVVPVAVALWRRNGKEVPITRILIGGTLTFVNTMLVYFMYAVGIIGTINTEDAETFYKLYPFVLLTLTWFLAGKFSGD